MLNYVLELFCTVVRLTPYPQGFIELEVTQASSEQQAQGNTAWANIDSPDEHFPIARILRWPAINVI
jgi:hypothetical protein